MTRCSDLPSLPVCPTTTHKPTRRLTGPREGPRAGPSAWQAGDRRRCRSYHGNKTAIVRFICLINKELANKSKVLCILCTDRNIKYTLNTLNNELLAAANSKAEIYNTNGVIIILTKANSTLSWLCAVKSNSV